MADEPLWGIGGGAGGATLIAIAFGVWDRFFRRREKVEDAEKSDRDHMRTYLDARGTAALERLDRDLARKDEELLRERARTEEVEQQRNEAYRNTDKAWDAARGWKVRCHALKHDLGGARGTLNAKLAGEGKPEVDWLDEALPALEDIVADNAAYVERKRAWVTRQNQLRAAARITFDPIDPPDQP